MSSTIALRCSSKRLKSVLFPTLGLPTIATVNAIKLPIPRLGHLDLICLYCFETESYSKLQKTTLNDLKTKVASA
jgi:hypothetical protein